MQAPNVISVAIIVGIIALCQALADTLPALGEPWVPFAVLALAAIVKGLQVLLQPQSLPQVAVTGAQSRLRRWLVG